MKYLAIVLLSALNLSSANAMKICWMAKTQALKKCSTHSEACAAKIEVAYQSCLKTGDLAPLIRLGAGDVKIDDRRNATWVYGLQAAQIFVALEGVNESIIGNRLYRGAGSLICYVEAQPYNKYIVGCGFENKNDTCESVFFAAPQSPTIIAQNRNLQTQIKEVGAFRARLTVRTDVHPARATYDCWVEYPKIGMLEPDPRRGDLRSYYGLDRPIIVTGNP